MILHGLFPLPLAVFDLGRELTKSETDFVNNQEKKSNQGNLISGNRYIINSKELTDLKNFFQESCNSFFSSVWSPSSNVRLKITQSWVNFTEKNSYHHPHTHPNSLVSGVFYTNVVENVDKITFFNFTKKSASIGLVTLDIIPKELNVFNTASWSLPVKNGMLVLFPSILEHMVEVNQNDHTRTSISFNTFLEGQIGGYVNLTELNVM